MIEAGIAIVQALQALADQTENKVMRDVIRDVCTRVESGESFSEALQKHPKTFNKLYYSMVSRVKKAACCPKSSPSGHLSGKCRTAA